MSLPDFNSSQSYNMHSIAMIFGTRGHIQNKDTPVKLKPLKNYNSNQ